MGRPKNLEMVKWAVKYEAETGRPPTKKEYRKEYDRLYTLTYGGQEKEYNRKYHVKHREQLCSNMVKYNKTPKGREARKVSDQNRRARKLELPNTLTREQWKYSLDYFDNQCVVCGQTDNLHSDHWIPISYTGNDNPGTVARNIIPLCGPCNQSKSNTLPSDWLRRILSEEESVLIERKVSQYFDIINKKEG